MPPSTPGSWRSTGRDSTTDHHRQPQDATPDLVARAQAGDRAAMETLCGRYLPRLARWASGRLPTRARGPLDTGDLVQVTLLRTLQRLTAFQPRHHGAFAAYLRTAVRNLIRDEVRRCQARPEATPLCGLEVDTSPSPLEEVVGRDLVDRYQAALERLHPTDQALLVLRIEMDLDYADIAATVGRPSPDAARVAVRRAVLRLAEGMDHVRREAKPHR